MLENAFLNGKICLVNASGIYTHVVQSKESQGVRVLWHMVHRGHSADIAAMLFDPSDIWVAVCAVCMGKVQKIMKIQAGSTLQ